MTSAEKKEISLRSKEEIQKENGEPTRPGVYYSPAVDIFETPTAITVLADMPGVAKENLDIDVRDRVLTITGTVSEMPERNRLVYREYGIGGYTRRFSLSDKVDQSKISAALKDGVLTLTLPKAEPLQPRKIAIAAQSV